MTSNPPTAPSVSPPELLDRSDDCRFEPDPEVPPLLKQENDDAYGLNSILPPRLPPAVGREGSWKVQSPRKNEFNFSDSGESA